MRYPQDASTLDCKWWFFNPLKGFSTFVVDKQFAQAASKWFLSFSPTLQILF